MAEPQGSVLCASTKTERLTTIRPSAEKNELKLSKKILSKEELKELVNEDSKLADDIHPENPCAIKCSEIQTVLITGVTGNFGPYVLRELSRRQEIVKIYCIIRERKISTPKERLTQMLEEKKLLGDIDMDRVECIGGDVTKPLLGLSPEIYSNLAEEVDGIFNLSVRSAILKHYSIMEPSRAVNVIGTNHIIRFACAEKTKPIYHASSTLACGKLGDDGKYLETWPVDEEYENRPNSAYVISKFIAERLMEQAVDRGVPCKAFRFPFMTGDSVLGGNIDFVGNWFLMKMIVYMFLGIMPAGNMPFIVIPVDICAEMSMKIFFNDETESEVYNVNNPHVGDEMKLQEIAKEFGYSVEPIEKHEFYEIVRRKNEEKKNVILSAMCIAAGRPEDIDDYHNNLPEAFAAEVAGQKDVFLSKKLLKFIPDDYPSRMEPAWDILKKELQFAKDVGIFAMIGLKN